MAEKDEVAYGRPWTHVQDITERGCGSFSKSKLCEMKRILLYNKKTNPFIFNKLKNVNIAI